MAGVSARDTKWGLLVIGCALVAEGIYQGAPWGYLAGAMAILQLVAFGIMWERYP